MNCDYSAVVLWLWKTSHRMAGDGIKKSGVTQNGSVSSTSSVKLCLLASLVWWLTSQYRAFTRATFDLTAIQRGAHCWASVSWVGEKCYIHTTGCSLPGSLFPAGKRSNSNTTQYSQPVGQLASCVDKLFWQNNGMLSIGGNKFWTPFYRMIRNCCSSNHRLAILMDMLQDDR